MQFNNLRAKLLEKTLSSGEMKKREEVAKAIEREHPGMPKAKKMAIATATAKRVAEDREIEEAIRVHAKVNGMPSGRYEKDAEDEAAEHRKAAAQAMKQARKETGARGVGKGKEQELAKRGLKVLKYNEKDVVKEDENIEEGGMPASVIKAKTNLAHMQPAEFARQHPPETHSDERLQKMARLHGYKPHQINIYVDKRKKGLSEETLDEDKYGYSDAGFSLRPGDDEGKPRYSKEHDVIGHGGPKGQHSSSNTTRKPYWQRRERLKPEKVKIHMDVPYHKKEEAKKAGFDWDPEHKKWYHTAYSHHDHDYEKTQFKPHKVQHSDAASVHLKSRAAELQRRRKPTSEEVLDEMSMDSINHPTHGKIEWRNEHGVHMITTSSNGERIIHAMGGHKDIAKKWMAIKDKIKKSTNEEIEWLTETAKQFKGGPGWMLRADPALKQKIKDKQKSFAALRKWAGKPVPEKRVSDGN